MTILQEAESCSVTTDVWSSRRMHSYLGVTCHFITRNKKLAFESVLLSCSHLWGQHTGVNILAEFEEAVEKFNILQRLFRVVTDNASNMLKAFPESVSLPGFDIDDDDVDADDTVGCSDEEDEIDDLNDTSLIPKCISCFAHNLSVVCKRWFSISK